jgi:hypothetical protein
MRIYVAAAFQRQDEMRGVRDVLQALGHEVTSRWLDETATGPEGLSSLPDPAVGAPYALVDIEDLAAADTVISFTYEADSGRGGRHVEFGLAIAYGKRIILVGPRQHVFHCLPQVEHYVDWPRLVMAVSRHRAALLGNAAEPVIDLGYLSLPAETQQVIETGVLCRDNGSRGGSSLDPTPDCGYQPRKPAAATEMWWCRCCQEFHEPKGARTDD